MECQNVHRISGFILVVFSKTFQYNLTTFAIFKVDDRKFTDITQSLNIQQSKLKLIFKS